jgi:hypothetical protein
MVSGLCRAHLSWTCLGCSFNGSFFLPHPNLPFAASCFSLSPAACLQHTLTTSVRLFLFVIVTNCPFCGALYYFSFGSYWSSLSNLQTMGPLPFVLSEFPPGLYWIRVFYMQFTVHATCFIMFSCVLLFDSEDGGSRFCWNVSKILSGYTAVWGFHRLKLHKSIYTWIKKYYFII